MDTEVGRGVGVSSTWFQAGVGRASTADACGAPGRGDSGAVSLRLGGGVRWRSGPRPHPEAPDLGQVDPWVVQAMAQRSPSPCCWNLMLF